MTLTGGGGNGNINTGGYPLIAAGSISGSLGPRTSGTVNGFPATLGIQGNDIVLNVVPEPSTLALLGTGLLVLFGWVRMKHCSAPHNA